MIYFSNAEIYFMEMNNQLEKAVKLFNDYKLEESRELLEVLIKENNANELALLTLAKIHTRTQNYGEALNLFNRVLEIDANNSEAITGMQLIKNILQLTNNYYYENPYTDDDLYDF